MKKTVGSHKEKGFDVLVEAARKRRLKLTVQRLAVLREIAGRKDHPTAEVVYAAIRRGNPQASRATVYRALEALAKGGVIAAVGDGSCAVRYDPFEARHHHLICRRCGKIRDYEDPRLETWKPAPTPGGFQVEDYSIYFRGMCDDCRKKENAGKMSSRIQGGKR